MPFAFARINPVFSLFRNVTNVTSPSSNFFVRSLNVSRTETTGGGIRGQRSPYFFVPPKLLLYLEYLLQTYNKNKNLVPLNVYFALQNLKTWLRGSTTFYLQFYCRVQINTWDWVKTFLCSLTKTCDVNRKSEPNTQTKKLYTIKTQNAAVTI